MGLKVISKVALQENVAKMEKAGIKQKMIYLVLIQGSNVTVRKT